MDYFNTTVFYKCLFSITTCIVLSVVYIASLYMWKSPNDRNHPTSIKNRFRGVFIMTFISPLFLYCALDEHILQQHTLFKLLGLRTNGILQAFTIPLFLTMVLFLGPLYLQYINGTLKAQAGLFYWTSNIKNLIWIRNHIVAPLSEEFTFRSCMLPCLLGCFSPTTAIFLCPLFFGVSHLHHMIELKTRGVPYKTTIFVGCFQMLFTTVFGIYSAFLFYRTGHFLSSCIVHAFCNHMGFPDLEPFFSYKGKERLILIFMFVLGLVTWWCLLFPLTEPDLYFNDMIIH